jgi:membrane protease YdiL (CAAX protease family)
MKIVKGIFSVLLFPLIYLLGQVVVSAIYGAVVSIGATIKNQGAITSGEASLAEFSESLAEGMNFMIPLLISYAVVALVIFLLLRNDWSATKFWSFRGASIWIVIISICLGLGMNFAVSSAISLTGGFGIGEGYEALLSQTLGNNMWLELLAIGIIGPILEEVIFRGAVLSRMRGIMGLTWAIIAESILFGLIHMIPLQIMFASVLGLVFTLAYVWSRNIWVPIAMHIAVNSFSVLATYLPEQDLPLEASYFPLVLGIAISVPALLILHSRRIPSIRLPEPDAGQIQ